MQLIKNFRWNYDIYIILIAVGYILFAQVGIMLAFPESKAIPLWPAAGFSLAVFLMVGSRIWPAVSIGSLIAGVLIFNHYGIELTIESITALGFFMLVCTTEAFFAYFLLSRLIGTRNPFLNTSSAFVFIIIALAVSFIGGSIVALAFSTAQVFQRATFMDILLTYFTASVVGSLVATPFVLAWKKPFSVQMDRLVFLEVVVFLLVLAGVISTLYVEALAPTIEKSFPFLVMPFILWIAFRANTQLTMTSILVLTLTAAYFTSSGFGPFLLQDESDSLLMLQIFMGITAIIGFILNTTVWERAMAEKEIKRFNEKLEENVQKRTKELNEEISMRKATEEKIKISNRKLRKANAELDNFVYSVSHDLRAPIASVLGLINLAEKENDPKMIHKYLSLITKSAQQQDSFIRDILDLSRNSRLDVSQDVIEFEGIVNEIFEQLQYYNVNKVISKQISIDQKLSFHSDKKRLKVILNNLISNAIRYSNGKEPLIKVNIAVDEATARIQISDNGKGIEKEHIKNVFKMFYRATDDNAGSGLGLYIVKETVDKLRGSVTLESEVEEGTTVNIELPNLHYN